MDFTTLTVDLETSLGKIIHNETLDFRRHFMTHALSEAERSFHLCKLYGVNIEIKLTYKLEEQETGSRP